MRLNKLRNKTPKQLMMTLEHWKWNKESAINILVCYEIEKEEVLKEMTYLDICSKYHDDLIECVIEEYRGAY